MPLSILLFGQDMRLVETRKWVLEKSGFQIRTALNIPEFDSAAQQEQVALFLLCDSLSSEALTRALCLIKSRWPEAERLVLSAPSAAVDLEPIEKVFPAMEGPRKLVATIHQLLANAPAPPP